MLTIYRDIYESNYWLWLYEFFKWRREVGGWALYSQIILLTLLVPVADLGLLVMRRDAYMIAALPSWHCQLLISATKETRNFFIFAQNLPLQYLTTDTIITLTFIDYDYTDFYLFRLYFISTDILLLGYYGILTKNVSKQICWMQKK